MGLLRKPYEISYWEDVWQEAFGSTPAKYVEKRIFTIGSDTMDYQARAIEPVLTRKTNGEVNFSFKMYYQYIDNVTGEKVDNPFTPYLKNESKIKLNYNGEWFDLLIKNINKDSATKSYTYQLVDQHVTELSKNGFNVTLDSSLMNNLGTAEELGRKVLEDTDWAVSSEKIVQTSDEALVMLVLGQAIQASQIIETNESGASTLETNGAQLNSTATTIPSGKRIYAFYSCCSGDKPYRFQFIYKSDNDFDKDSDRIITTKNCQYCIDNIADWQTSGIYTLPAWASLSYPENESHGNQSALSILYRGRKYVFTHEMKYHAGLNMYLPVYQNAAGKEYFEYTKTNYVTPNLLKNLVVNDDFNTTAGWTGSKFCKETYNLPEGTEPKKLCTYLREYSQASWNVYGKRGYQGFWKVSATDFEDKNENIELGDIIYIDGVITDKNRIPIRIYAEVTNISAVNQNGNGKQYPNVGATTLGSTVFVDNAQINRETLRYSSGVLYSATEDMYNSQWNAGNDYFSVLGCTNMAKDSTYSVNKVITNNGPYSQRNSLEGFNTGDKYIIELEFYYASKVIDEGSKRYHYKINDQLPTNGGNAQVKVRLANFMPLLDRDGYHNSQQGHNNDYEHPTSGENKDDHDGNGMNDRVLFYSPAKIISSSEDNPNNYYGEITKANGLFSYTQEVEIKGTLSAEEFATDNYKFFIEFLSSGDTTIKKEDYFFIKKFRVYKKIPKTPTTEDGLDYYTPEDSIDTNNITYNTEKRYFAVTDNSKKFIEKQITNEIAATALSPKLSANGEKRTQVNVKESNYFNSIQQIAETFKCWPEIQVHHDDNGNITTAKDGWSKRIYFRNYIGQPNYAGFRYGVNNKDIKRTLDSKQIVSKLIVKANANEFGKNGFCTIARAGANTTKDNVLYDFGYYIGQHMLNAATLQGHLYGDGNGIDITEDLTTLNSLLNQTEAITDSKLEEGIASFVGYYPKMTAINTRLETLSKLISEKSIPLAQEIATYNTYKPMYEAAIEELTKAKNNFYSVAGFQFESIGIDDNLSDGEETKAEKVRKSTTLSAYLEKILTYTQDADTALKKYTGAETSKADYESQIAVLEIQYDNALKFKNRLNKLFYATYSRFIQEGTWIDESYLDDNLYYNDAQSVLYTSSMPKVSYTVNVLSLAGIPGYEMFDFKIGDQTFVEDAEFFGYDDNGNPRRELITVTETSENLDDPIKNAIKVQNYENQFQDLFQRITATVQSVQYSEGAYDRAEELAMADKAHKLQFLSGTLSDASLALTNDGAQDYTLDANGLTLTSQVTGKRLRAKGGAILLGTTDNQGNETWKTGLTADGISADLITAGQVNTRLIQIMNGEEPTFRWDTHGITAYNFSNTNSDTYLTGLDTTKGVRFDRFGLYGYSGIDGETWKPKSVSGGTDGIDGGVPNIDSKSTFALTWEGLKVTGNNNTVARIGKMDDAIIKVNNGSNDTFIVEPDGDVTVKGTLILSSGDKVEDAINTSTNDAITNFIETNFEPFKSSIEAQVDGKAETWYQAEDPSTNWTTPALKRQHEGDLWKYTGDKTSTRDKNSEWIWSRILYKGSTEYEYDIWVYSGDFSKNSSWNTGYIYSATVDRVFGYYYHNGTEWIQAKTGAQTNWPSGAGPALVTAGKITTSQKCYIEGTKRLWSYTENNGWTAPENIEFGKWQEMAVPDEVFDSIDDKSNIFVALPDTGVQINEGDILIPSSDISKNEKTYSAGKVYRYIKKGGASNFSWEPIEYTDEDTVNSKIDEALEDLDLPDTANLVMKDDLVITKTVNESTGVTTIAVKDKDGNDISSTTIGEKYVATDVGLGAGQLENGKKFILEADGTLNADNAVIHGTIFANEGYIAGWHVSQSKSDEDYSGSLTYGELGKATGFHMYGNNYGVTGTIAGKTIDTANSTHPGWKLGIGSGFGVTSDGGVYATHGKIGNMTIEQINDITGSGQNLLLKSNTPKIGSEYPLKTYSFDVIPQAGKTYNVSLKGELGAGCDRFGIYNSGGWISLKTLKPTAAYTGTVSNVALASKYFTVSITNKPTDDWNKLFTDGIIIAATNGSTDLSSTSELFLNIGRASDTDPDAPQHGYKLKINGQAISSTNSFVWPANTVKYFQFKRQAGKSKDSDTLNYGYWDTVMTLSGSFTWTNTNTSYPVVVPSKLHVYAMDANGQVSGVINKIFEIKLEEGMNATPWCLAASEMATTAQLTVTEDTILSKVSEVEGEVSEVRQTAEAIDASVGEMVVSYVATANGVKGTTDKKGSYFTATVTTATRPKEWKDMFYNGAILKINFSNTSAISFTAPVNINIASASDESPDAGGDGVADYGFPIKPNGAAISSTNVLNIKAGATVLFQFHTNGSVDSNGYSLGYWDTNISRNGAWSGLNVKTSGISADSLSREGDGYRFTLTSAGGFKVDSRESADKSWANVMTVNDTGLTIQGNATFTGTINASGGRIGEWNIGDVPSTYIGSTAFTDALYSQAISETESYTTIIRASSSSTDWAIVNILKERGVAGTKEVFGIRHDGKLYATNADITGNITATSGSIGEWKLSSESPDDGAVWDYSGSIQYDGSGTYGAGGYEQYKIRLMPRGIYIKYGSSSAPGYAGVPWGLLVRMVETWVNTEDTDKMLGGKRYLSDFAT